MPTLRVAGQSDPKSTATAIERRVIDYRAVKLEAVGANSVNQAVKSIAIARVNLENDGRSCAVYSDFIHIPSKEEGESERSALQLYVFSCPPSRWYDRSGDYDYYDRYGSDSRIIRVSQKNDAKTVANTIANKMRNDNMVCNSTLGCP